jgi:hypothetical protein
MLGYPRKPAACWSLAARWRSTVLEGKFALRVAITNHRSRREDFEILVHQVIGLGRKLLAQFT